MVVSEKKRSIKNPTDLANILQTTLASESELDQDKEHFWVIGLNTRNVIQFIELVSLGTLNASLVHPREVYRVAIAKNSASLILAHNHPSGEFEPSDDDVELTKRLSEAGRILGIEVLDHVIVGNKEEGFTSFKQRGLL